jgi:hypothetical protein
VDSACDAEHLSRHPYERAQAKIKQEEDNGEDAEDD